jgi:ABC-type dipeptide/oligopeptide/nickel transport system permease component
MARYAGGRLAQGLLVVVLAIVLSFALVNVAGDPVSALGVIQLTEEQRDALISQYGYDEPLLQRLADYLTSALRGDFGESFRSGEPALDLVLDALPNTAILVAAAVALAFLVAVPVAVHSVLRRDSRTDRALRRALIVLQGIPDFWLALVLILVFAVQLQWFPAIGNEGPLSIVLPAAALAIPLMSTFVRLLRAQLLDVLTADFVAALRARGLSRFEILLHHAGPNTFAPLSTYFALQLGWLLAGTLIVETVFAWPGIGTLAVTSTNNQDLPVIEAIIVVTALAYVLFNLLVDLAVMVLDPRIRVGRA